ncbi:hypothetical protein Tco_0582862 [Tanacetum coccineum]
MTACTYLCKGEELEGKWPINVDHPFVAVIRDFATDAFNAVAHMPNFKGGEGDGVSNWTSSGVIGCGTWGKAIPNVVQAFWANIADTRGNAGDFGYFWDVGFGEGYIGGSGSWHFITIDVVD